jgi:hypothetical protein
LRSMVSELGMVTLPSAIAVPNVQNALNENGVPADPQMHQYTAMFFDELLWYMKALRAARAGGVPY